MTTSTEVREFAARLAGLEAQVRNRSSQLAFTALEDGAVREFNLDGTLVAQYGKQYDGTSGPAVLVSPPPPAPSAPVATGTAGGLRVTWDGTFGGDPTIVAPMDWRQTDVVVGPVGMDPIATPPSGAFTSPRGGDMFLPKLPGDYVVALVTRTLSGRPSDPSPTAAVTVTAVVTTADTDAINLAVQQAQAAADQAQASADAIPATVTQAKADAIATATGNATSLADAAKADAIASAAADATTKAGNAQAAAIAAAANDATSKANQAKTDAINAAALTAQDKADLAQANAIAAAAADATTKANNAQTAATNAAATDAQTKADAAKNAAIAAAATDAQNKASLAQANAIAASVGKTTIVGTTGIFRDLAKYAESINGATGSLVIDTPITFGNYMTRVEISGYNYQSGLSEISLIASFYAYNSGGVPTVVNGQYTNLGTKRSTVRYAWKGDGTSAGSTLSIIIDYDAANPLWYYPKLSVDVATIGQSTPPTTFANGWTISRKTDLTGYTFAVPASKRDVDDSASLVQSWRTTGQVTIDGGKLTADSVTAGQIAANAITALELAADSVIAAKIKAGEIIAGKLAASAVIAGNIATDAVTANTIAAGAIIAGKLAADSVLAANIKAGEVVAGKLAASAVIAGNIATGAVTAGTIAAGAVTAGTIAAGAITARDVAIGDLTNMSELSETTSGAVSWNTWTSAMGGTSNQWFTRAGTRDGYFMFRNQKGPLPFKTGDRVRFTFEAYASAAVNAIPTVWGYDPGVASQGAQIAIGTTPATYAVEVPITFDTLGKTRYLVGLIQGSSSNLSTTDLFVRNVSVRRMGAGELIVDGSIVAGKMAANSIIAGNIAADAVTATTVAAGAIIAGKLATDSVLAANIKAGEIVAGKLAANAVIAGNIATNAVTAGTIAAGAITTDKLDAAAINGMTITGAVMRTSATASTTGGIVIDTNGISGYSATGGLMTYISNAGILSSFGGSFNVTGSGGAGLQISPNANGGRAGIQFTNSSSDTGKGSLLAGDGTAYPIGTISLGSGEATLNSTGRAELTLNKGGDFKLVQSFGANSQAGIEKIGADVYVRNNLILPSSANIGWITAASMRPIDSGWGGAVESTTLTTFQTYASGPGVWFTAPPSGTVRVDAFAYGKSSVAGSWSEFGAFLKTGNTIGSGTFVTSDLVFVTSVNQWIRNGGWALFTGLTPGALYNVTLAFRNATAGNTASMSASRVMVTPWM